MKASGIFKLSTLALLTTAAMGAQAGISADTAQGTFAVSGDVEFNNDIDKSETAAGDTTFIHQGGRVLVGVSGMRQVGDTNYISANAQLLLDMDGNPGTDDAWVAIGAENDWEVKLGRFEAYNLMPAGQDIYVNNSDGATFYGANAARGRSADGQINLSKTMGSTYLELSTNFMPAGNAETNAVFLRPVVSVGLGDAFRLAAGAEINATADSADAANDFTGYGATVNYSADDLSVNVSYATRDYDTTVQEDTTINANVTFAGFGLGYQTSTKDITTSETEVNTFYASYKIANVMDVEDLALYLGASTSEQKDSDVKDSGVRVRVKYVF